MGGNGRGKLTDVKRCDYRTGKGGQADSSAVGKCVEASRQLRSTATQNAVLLQSITVRPAQLQAYEVLSDPEKRSTYDKVRALRVQSLQ